MSSTDQWDTHVTEEGQTYYHNRISGETTWELPSKAAPADFAARNQAQQTTGGTWEAVWSEEQQMYYYYNQATETTQWENPEGTAHEASAAAHNLSPNTNPAASGNGDAMHHVGGDALSASTPASALDRSSNGTQNDSCLDSDGGAWDQSLSVPHQVHYQQDQYHQQQQQRHEVQVQYQQHPQHFQHFQQELQPQEFSTRSTSSEASLPHGLVHPFPQKDHPIHFSMGSPTGDLIDQAAAAIARTAASSPPTRVGTASPPVEKEGATLREALSRKQESFRRLETAREIAMEKIATIKADNEARRAARAMATAERKALAAEKKEAVATAKLTRMLTGTESMPAVGAVHAATATVFEEKEALLSRVSGDVSCAAGVAVPLQGLLRSHDTNQYDTISQKEEALWNERQLPCPATSSNQGGDMHDPLGSALMMTARTTDEADGYTSAAAVTAPAALIPASGTSGEAHPRASPDAWDQSWRTAEDMADAARSASAGGTSSAAAAAAAAPFRGIQMNQSEHTDNSVIGGFHSEAGTSGARVGAHTARNGLDEREARNEAGEEREEDKDEQDEEGHNNVVQDAWEEVSILGTDADDEVAMLLSAITAAPTSQHHAIETPHLDLSEAISAVLRGVDAPSPALEAGDEGSPSLLNVSDCQDTVGETSLVEEVAVMEDDFTLSSSREEEKTTKNFVGDEEDKKADEDHGVMSWTTPGGGGDIGLRTPSAPNSVGADHASASADAAAVGSSATPESIALLERAVRRVTRLMELLGSVGSRKAWANRLGEDDHLACSRLVDLANAGATLLSLLSSPSTSAASSSVCKVFGSVIGHNVEPCRDRVVLEKRGRRLCSSAMVCLAVCGRVSPSMWADLSLRRDRDAVSTKEDSGPPEEPLTTTHTDDRITTTPTIHSGPSPATPASSPSAIPASLISSPDTSTVASSDGASNAVTRLTGSTKLTRLMSICVDVAIRVGSESTSRRVGLDEREYFHGKGEGGWDYPATDEAGGNEEAELTRMALTLIYEILAGCCKGRVEGLRCWDGMGHLVGLLMDKIVEGEEGSYMLATKGLLAVNDPFLRVVGGQEQSAEMPPSAGFVVPALLGHVARHEVQGAVLHVLNEEGYPNGDSQLTRLCVKFCSDVFEADDGQALFYVNDLKVLVDIAVRELDNVPVKDTLRAGYVEILRRLSEREDWTTRGDGYRQADIERVAGLGDI